MNTAVTSLLPTPSGNARAPAGVVLRSWLSRTATALWRGIEASGQARARQHLMSFADQCDALQPELAKELRMASRSGPMA